MTQTQWAELRQVGLATLDHEAAVRTATELLELGPGFDDPLLAAWHLADFTAPIGTDTYLEILTPTTPDHSMTRWLSRVGGASGWVLSTQVPSLDGVNERAAEHGVRPRGRSRGRPHWARRRRPARHRPGARGRPGRRVVSHRHPVRLTRAPTTALTAAHTCGLRGGHGTKPLVRLT
jgi:hypothetical protein